jgi:hypothetical protein
MNLTETYAFPFELKPDGAHTAEINDNQTLKAEHKLVLAFASISYIGHHTGEPTPVALASVAFQQYTQHGAIVPAKVGPVIGNNITDIHWTARAEKCWTRGSVVIMAFD